MWLAGLAMLACGCGRVGFDAFSGTADAAGANDATSDIAGACPEGYGVGPTGCYRVVVAPQQTWLAAEVDCETADAHLVVIDDDAERVAIAALLPNSTDAWIGVSDRVTAGVYLAVTGAPAFQAWSPGEPDGSGNCVKLDPDVFRDFDCAGIDDYVCEYDGLAANPGAF